ncbi:MAG: CHAT domain-containing protein [Pyrinomonadaceae bacterium]
MTKALLITLLVMTFVLPSALARAGRDEDVLVRESDERAISAEERERALGALLSEASRLRDAGETLRATRFLNRAGRLQLLLNRTDESLATYKDALAANETSQDLPTEVDSLNGLGSVQSHLSMCKEANESLRRALELSEQGGYVAGKAEALLTLSECQGHDHPDLAFKNARESLALWESVGSRWGMAKSYTAIGNQQLLVNNLPEATQSHEAALAIWRELDIADEQAESLINLGFIEYRKGAWQSTLTYLTQAQMLLDGKSDPFMQGQINSGLAEAFIESGLPEAGLDKLQQSLEYFRQSKQKRSIVAISMLIGKTNYLLGNHAEALAQLQQALADAEAINEPVFAAMCDEYLGRTYAATNDRVNAMRYLQAALAAYPKLGNRMEAARTLALIGQLYEQEGRVEQALDSYRRALETFDALEDRLNQSAALYALGSLELRRNNLDAAEDYLRQSIDVTDNIRRVSTSTDLTAAFSATIYERYEKYVECLMRRHEATPARGFDARAFEVSDSARARSLTELLRATQSDLLPGLEADLAEQERTLRQSLRVKEDSKVTMLSGKYERKEMDALVSDITKLEADYAHVTESIRARHPAYMRVARRAALGSREIQEQVVGDDETVLLEYSIGSDRSYVWAVTRDHVKSYRLPARAQLNDAAGRVYKALESKPDEGEELTAASAELSRMILSPVASELDKRRIIVVADGALNYIPFQALPVPSNPDDEPLVASHEVVNAPSASILGELRQEALRRRPSKILAAFGDPVFASDYAQRKNSKGGGALAAVESLATDRLKGAPRDVGAAGETFDPSLVKPLFYAKHELANLRGVAEGESLVATDFDASREHVLATDLTQYAILHFATHGFLDTKRPENSGLVLSTVDSDGRARNGFVGLQDIYGLRAPVDLVVLSACQTALGKDVRGEGLLSLTRGFMYAGASSVVASLWKVDDEATAELMKQFYTNLLRKGMPPAAALSAAQNSIRRRPEWRSPHYWAAFTLQGEYRQVIRPVPPTGVNGRYLLTGACVTLLTLSACGAWWYRRRRVRLA